jgi:rubredoxin
MARWILKCDNCDFEFTHSMISDQSAESYFLPQKPVFTETGFECPNCGNKDAYDRHDLVYRA